jgi:hypothetical protein
MEMAFLEEVQISASGRLERSRTERKGINMIQSSLELIKAIQSDYEHKAQHIYLVKLARGSRPKSHFRNKLEWLGKDLSYLAYRIVNRYRKHA